MTIRNRITLWFTALVAVLMVVSGTVGWLGMREHLYNVVVKEIHQKSRKVQEVMDALVLEHKKHQKHGIQFQVEVPEILTEILTQEGTSIYHGSFIQLTNTRGQIFARSPNLRQQNLPILAKGTLKQIQINLPEHHHIDTLYYSTSIMAMNKTVATVQIALPLLETNYMLQQLALYRLLELLLVIVIAVLFGQFLSRRALAPMVEMTKDVQRMAGSDLLKRVDLEKLSPDEIRQLAETFNNLLDRIAEVFLRQHRFISDASHELRSPLTAIRGYAELVLKRGRNNPEIFEECLSNVIQETQRLERLVSDLLVLARAKEKSLRHEETDLVRLVTQLFDKMEPLHPNLKISGLCGAIPFWGDPDAIKQVLLNLIDNALRVTHQPDTVLVTWERIDNQAIVRVQDRGPGIEAKHLPHLFDRFYRVDDARNRSQGGNGLGLAISKEIIENHGGKITVTSTPGQGSCFAMILPLQETSLCSEEAIQSSV